ncbi:hypothetical protein [Roseomonas sp. CECT 9278]|uniref:hypothetical protein n=1 Tax=Roseomonas sp. CECT 9278 TaxID=2845823 RepID=UPI001E2E40AC|nr:hypothetical protein [Roseomonas sp. CECT 9278]CAH0150415.1 hypothetical protein ROS9278_00705 [Roseomonas sp. CECT 9278]
MNMMMPRKPQLGALAPFDALRTLTALEVAGCKAVRACRRKNLPGVDAIHGLLDDWLDLSPGRRRDLRTAISLLARASGKELAAIEFTRANVIAILDATTPVACGVSPASFGAYRSWIGYVLKRLGLMAERHRAASDLMTAWAPLVAVLDGVKEWIRLRAFVRYCSDHGIAPGEVTDTVLAAYQAHLLAADIRGTARATIRRVVHAWNAAVEAVPGWPTSRLTAPAAETRQYSFKFDEYPPALQADVATFNERLTVPIGDDLYGPDDEDEDDGPRLALRPATVTTRMKAVRLLLAAAVHTGTPIASITSLAVLVEIKTAKAILNWHWIRAGRRTTDHTGVLSDTLKVIAKHHVRLPPERMAKLIPVLAKAKPPKRKGMTEKNTRLLRELEDPTRRAQILHLPRHMMKLAARLREGWIDADSVEHAPRPGEAARIASLAAAIELELQCPLRLETLDHLRIGVQLQRNGGQRNRISHVVLTEDDMKNHQPLEWTLEDTSAALLDDYVRLYRPLLPHAVTDWLFSSKTRDDGPRGKKGLGTAITREIHSLVGVRMTPHQFRAFAGALILERNPHAIEDLRLILGHSTTETAMRYYARWAPKEAVARFNAQVTVERRKTRLVADAAFARSPGPLGHRGPARRGPGRRRQT